MPRRMRFQSLFLSLTMLVGIVVSASPAQAAIQRGTASVNVHEVISGEQTPFAFHVINGGSAGLPPVQAADSSYNFVAISPPTTAESFRIDWVSAPTGWTPSALPDGAVGFAADQDHTIAPGSFEDFTVTATVDTIAADFTDAEWIVQVSDNGGQTLLAQNPTTANSLTTAIRVLDIDSVLFAAPAPVVANHRATAQQEGVLIDNTVTNHGSAPLEVTPSLGTSGGDTVKGVSPATATIDPGASQVFEFTVDIGNNSGAGGRQFTGDATAPGANAKDKASDPLQVEPAAAFAYAGGTLTPTASPSGLDQTFRLSLNKSQPPSVDIDPATTTLSFTKTVGGTSPLFSTTLAAPTTTGRGSQSVGLEFLPVTIPAGADIDGAYTPHLVINGTDDNGATVTSAFDLGNSFEIDNLVPVLKPTLDGPAGQSDPEGASVVKDDDTLTIGGSARKGGPDGSPNDVPDPSVTITGCELVVVDDDFVTQNTIELPVGATGCRNNAGNLTGTGTGTFGVGSGWVRVDMTGEDTAGNEAIQGVQDYVRIDNVVPFVEKAVTGCGAEGLSADAACDDMSTVRVFLNEPVKGMFLPTDFTVLGHTVTNAEARSSADGSTACTSVNPPSVTPGEGLTPPTITQPSISTAFCDVVILTLSPDEPLTEDEKPAVAYNFQALGPRARPQDGPLHDLADSSVDAIDGIVPDLPTLDAVSQGKTTETFKGSQGDAFYTNLAQPTFQIGGLGLGYTGVVALDNGATTGQFDDSDTVLCQTADDATECTGGTALTSGDNTVLVTAYDPAGNLAEGKEADTLGLNARSEAVVLDEIAPTATEFASDTVARTITVSFDEPLAGGRDFAVDWSAFAIEAGREFKLRLTSVSGSDASRVLTVDDTETRFTTGADIVRYTLAVQDESVRYLDRAGNTLGNFEL